MTYVVYALPSLPVARHRSWLPPSLTVSPAPGAAQALQLSGSQQAVMKKHTLSKQVNAFPGRLMHLCQAEDAFPYRHLEEGGEKGKGTQ